MNPASKYAGRSSSPIVMFVVTPPELLVLTSTVLGRYGRKPIAGPWTSTFIVRSCNGVLRRSHGIVPLMVMRGRRGDDRTVAGGASLTGTERLRHGGGSWQGITSTPYIVWKGNGLRKGVRACRTLPLQIAERARARLNTPGRAAGAMNCAVFPVGLAPRASARGAFSGGAA